MDRNLELLDVDKTTHRGYEGYITTATAVSSRTAADQLAASSIRQIHRIRRRVQACGSLALGRVNVAGAALAQLVNQVTAHRLVHARQKVLCLLEAGPAQRGGLALTTADNGLGVAEQLARKIEGRPSGIGMGLPANFWFGYQDPEPDMFINYAQRRLCGRLAGLELTSDEGPEGFAVVVLNEEHSRLAGHDSNGHLGMGQGGYAFRLAVPAATCRRGVNRAGRHLPGKRRESEH